VAEIFEYRHEINERIVNLLEAGDCDANLQETIELGLHHEQQHQELMLTDIKHVFSCNPMAPAFRTDEAHRSNGAPVDDTEPGLNWIEFEGGIHELGATGDEFCFDNELPRHRTLLEPYRLAHRLVTNGEFLEFVESGGYDDPEYWLSLGWATREEQQWEAPLYWRKSAEGWSQFTLNGLRSLDLKEPVCHVSYFEADAFARWQGKRLPTEAEWEIAASEHSPSIDSSNFVESNLLHPQSLGRTSRAPSLQQLFGDVWEWTSSAYSPYPGYTTPAGAIGEYNGKFMCSQLVLRGGSCATPTGHVRPTYRNFFHPPARWQFSGIQLARDP